MPVRKSRNLYLDVMKGFTAFLVIWGHCIQQMLESVGRDPYSEVGFGVLYSFHMPLFMLICGFFFHKSVMRHSFSELVLGQLRSMGIPILIWSVLPTVLREVKSLPSGEGVHWNYVLDSFTALWFLACVLVFSLTTAVVVKKCPIPDRLLDPALLAVCVMVVCLPIPALVYMRNDMLYMLPYFLLGYWFGKYGVALTQYRLFWPLGWVTAAVYPVLMSFFGRDSFIQTTGMFPHDHDLAKLPWYFWNDIFRYAVGLSGSVFALLLISLFLKWGKKSLLWKGLAMAGRYSLEVYVLQTAVYLRLLKQLGQLLSDSPWMNSPILLYGVTTPIISLLSLIAFIILLKILEKIHLKKLLFGR